MIEWFTPRMTGAELSGIETVLNSGFINDGPVTREFERQIAALVNRNYAVAVPSGTVAIALALMACGADCRDDVIVPDFTFIATANAVRLVGANVVLCDVDQETFCLTSETVDAVLTAKTRFVLAVEVNGRSPNYDDLIDYCRIKGLILITDSCEALGSSYCGKPLGKFGKASCISFSPNKLVTTGQGGMVVTDDEDVYKRLLELKQQGMERRGHGGAEKYPSLGFNFKFTDIQAAVGLAQLKALDARKWRCIERDLWYRQALDGLDIEFPPNEHNSVHLWTDIVVDNQHTLTTHLARNNIGCRQFWYPLHRQAPYAFAKHFPVSMEVSAKGIWLPSSYDITEAQVEQVADCIKCMTHTRN